VNELVDLFVCIVCKFTTLLEIKNVVRLGKCCINIGTTDISEVLGSANFVDVW